MDLLLPHPDVLWARAALLDVLLAVFARECFEPTEAAPDIGTHAIIGGGRLTKQDGAGNWFELIIYPDDRAVLFGWDESHELDTAYDPTAAAPTWVLNTHLATADPRVVDGTQISFVRWWENGEWHSTPTDLSDGLDMGLRNLADKSIDGEMKQFADFSEEISIDIDTDEVFGVIVDTKQLTQIRELADQRRLTRDDLEFLGAELVDPICDYLEQAGVLSGTSKVTALLPLD
ncbi:hypothetical protein [Nocardia huaxiensis]|uniref:Uncharacterized protein n=1 Tax=Nocardia huaxiensis TaxID=2755382 RepID=A0A7D6VB25_9NOCA|nr:hypothetical protein [Nocardia huaxiensis]QLY27935.1 hypothetical protein H0264_21180 [Nocardia huaxiensis]UFS98654.1 hypothetical protein LPY97_12510 [Nocardia huaxiensis]